MHRGTLPFLALRLFSALVAVLLCSQLSNAQQAVTAATLTGRIQDKSEALVSGATVIATNLELNQRYTTTTNYDGKFRFPLLRVGNYLLRIEADGFVPLEKQLTVSIGQTL